MSEVERYWIDPNRLVQEGWHQDDTCVVKDWAYDRVVAERDAPQQRLTAADERTDVLEGLLRESKETHVVLAKDIAAERRYQPLPGWMGNAESDLKHMNAKIGAALKQAEGAGDDA
ncbi:hypothetical protein MHB_0010870 [Pseudomonas fluorescens BBc6R8]|uniref:hypothetical protein n=1 Tax=Pseudomonas fluorescens TaxID=294 RepID=UPI000281C9FB|nr:hypothetical protein [Pseudomonas fluorescens]QQD56717.1 hypothetical protein MHB_0010870 [Pseudomonas fluorescens BBc6R8]